LQFCAEAVAQLGREQTEVGEFMPLHGAGLTGSVVAGMLSAVFFMVSEITSFFYTVFTRWEGAAEEEIKV